MIAGVSRLVDSALTKVGGKLGIHGEQANWIVAWRHFDADMNQSILSLGISVCLSKKLIAYPLMT